MYDRIRGIEQDVLITDHVNRSGLFFLRGKTPHEGFPMFPDMSNVYEKNNNFWIYTFFSKFTFSAIDLKLVYRFK